MTANEARSGDSLITDVAGIEGYLQNLVELAADVVVPPASVGITWVRDGAPGTVLSSSETASYVDELQYSAGDGPCLHSIRIGEKVASPDLALEARWPAWVGRAMEKDIKSVLATPLSVDGDLSACVNLYGFMPNSFTEAEVRRVDIFAAQISTALTMSRRLETHERHVAEADAALRSRAVIDQAAGIIMAQQRCSADEAMRLLRTHSSNSNRKLRDIAVEIVERTSGAPPTESAGFVREPGG
jgi:GAF domain-containing protein